MERPFTIVPKRDFMPFVQRVKKYQPGLVKSQPFIRIFLRLNKDVETTDIIWGQYITSHGLRQNDFCLLFCMWLAAFSGKLNTLLI